MKGQLPSLAELIIQAEDSPARKRRGRGAHSLAFHWMHRHFAEMPELVSFYGWAALADAMNKKGVSDGEDKPLNPERARQTWFKVRRFVERRGAETRVAVTSHKQRALPQVWDALPLIPARPEPEPDPDAAEQVRAKIERLNKSLNR